ncbi:MAG: hypothetical protein L0099_04820, partial [Acidobacteria bacterium]|nr:hypothetical protein [Acidobacteriota bacterium]
AEAARRFGYQSGSFRILCWRFRHHMDRDFFRDVSHGPKTQPRKNAVRARVIAMRKKNLSVYDIRDELERTGKDRLSVTGIQELLREEGFARLPRRGDEERPNRPRPTADAIADARHFSLAPREFSTRVGGLFLLLPLLARLDLEALVRRCGLPGTQMIPAAHAVRAALVLKLIGKARRSHVMDLVFDEGVALAVGLNAIPKTTYMSQYSSRLGRKAIEGMLGAWVEKIRQEKLLDATSFNLDFHSISYFGEDPFVEKHYVPRRSQRRQAVLAFLAQDAGGQVFCYSNADIRKGEESDEVLRFVGFWQNRYGELPRHLVFDSKLTTYANLSKLNKMGITFITLRRRSPALTAECATTARPAWRTVMLDVPHRKFKTPRVVDQRITLKGYNGTLRQLLIRDLGHEQPTILITNDLTSSLKSIITRYARRMLIENGLADSVEFFHLDALSSAVALNVDFDVLLTVMGSGIYRLFARSLRGFQQAQARQIFRRFLDTTARVAVLEDQVLVRLPRRAHNPILLDAGIIRSATPIPWWEGRALRFEIP